MRFPFHAERQAFLYNTVVGQNAEVLANFLAVMHVRETRRCHVVRRSRDRAGLRGGHHQGAAAATERAAAGGGEDGRERVDVRGAGVQEPDC